MTRMNYWAGLEREKIAVLIWGDTSGSVVMLEFELSQRTPLFGIPVKERALNTDNFMSLKAPPPPKKKKKKKKIKNK